MRIALISDIHGNEAALDAVLADATREGADQVVCLGDVATLGPRPGAVLARLRALGCPCILGNHDAFLLEPALVRSYTEAPVVVDSVDWCRAQLGAEDLAFVRTFEPGRTLALAPGVDLLLFHGSPRSHMEDLLATTAPDALDEKLGGRRASVMAGGHTHVQMLRQHRGDLLLNPGSVGMPFREYVGGRAPTLLDHAEYATVDAARGGVRVTLHRVPVDPRARRAALAGSTLPLAPMLRQSYGAA